MGGLHLDLILTLFFSGRKRVTIGYMDFAEKIKDAIRGVVGGGVEIELFHPTVLEHGDYATNVALKLGGNSMEKAEEISGELEENSSVREIVERIEVASPGFINFWITKDALAREAEMILQKGEKYGYSEDGRGKTIVVDYSGPNIAKRFSVGHLRSTIIGQAIVNLYKFWGWDVKGDNHLGDWGRQFGVLLYQIISKGIKADDLTVDQMEELYVEFNKETQENPDIWDEARLWFKKLEEGDSEARGIWTTVRDKTLEEFKRIYKLLDVGIDYAYGESFYTKMMPEVIKEAQEKGLARESEGALIVEFPGGEYPPAILRKSDETTNYFTRDLATIKFRLKKWNPDLIVYEVGSEQALHFQQLFKTAEMLGWAQLECFVHVKHGLYLSPEGRKFSTRKGDIVRLDDVLNEAIRRAKNLGAARDDVARAVGVGAVKYFDLSHQPASNIIFDWEKMMALEGNSAPYLQYTYARCRSVLLQAGMINFQFLISNGLKNLSINNEEMMLLRNIYRFPEVAREAADTFSPNILANYLFELSQKFNTFYSMHRVLGTDEQHNRLILVAAVSIVLKNGLGILGISTPERL